MAIRFPKENIAEFNWFKFFKSKELLLINVFSKEEKENFTGRLVIYDRDLRTEYAEFKEQTCFNIKQVDCPEISAKEHEVDMGDGRKIDQSVEDKFYLLNSVRPSNSEEESKTDPAIPFE